MSAGELAPPQQAEPHKQLARTGSAQRRPPRPEPRYRGPPEYDVGPVHSDSQSGPPSNRSRGSRPRTGDSSARGGDPRPRAVPALRAVSRGSSAGRVRFAGGTSGSGGDNSMLTQALHSVTPSGGGQGGSRPSSHQSMRGESRQSSARSASSTANAKGATPVAYGASDEPPAKWLEGTLRDKSLQSNPPPEWYDGSAGERLMDARVKRQEVRV